MTAATGDLASRGGSARVGDGALATAAAVAFAAQVVVAVARGSIGSPSGITDTVAQVAVLLAGAISLQRPAQRGSGRLMLALVTASGVTDVGYGYPGAGPFAFLSDVLPWLEDVLLGHLLMRWPAALLQTRGQRVVTGIGYLVLVPLMIVVDFFWSAAAAREPPGTWWPTLWFDRSLSIGLFRVGVVLFGALLLAFAALVVARVRRASRPERRELLAVAAAIALLVLSGALNVVFELTGQLGVAANLVANLGIAAVPVTFLIAVAVRRVQRALAIEALAAHGSDTGTAGVVAELRRAMGDPRLDVATYSMTLGRYAGDDGAPAPEIAAGRRALFVPAADGTPLARLDVAAALAGRQELSGSVARAALAALESSRLRVELRRRAADEEVARRRLEESTEEGARLSRMLPGGLPQKLRADPAALGRIDEAVVTVVMSDVRGYTAIAERTPPARLAEQLREHRAAMNTAILAEGGTVMQYVGDAVMAVFGAPFAQADHARRAVRAAAAMHAAQAAVNEGWAIAGWDVFGLGIGVSSGPVAAAVLGSEERYEYTIVGDTVNLAQRLESEARPGGTTVLSAATVAAAGSLAAEPLPLMQVKGRAAPVQAYRVVTAVGSRGPDDRIGDERRSGIAS